MDHSWGGDAVMGARSDARKRLKQEAVYKTGRSRRRWMKVRTAKARGCSRRRATGNSAVAKRLKNRYPTPTAGSGIKLWPFVENALLNNCNQLLNAPNTVRGGGVSCSSPCAKRSKLAVEAFREAA